MLCCRYCGSRRSALGAAPSAWDGRCTAVTCHGAACTCPTRCPRPALHGSTRACCRRGAVRCVRSFSTHTRMQCTAMPADGWLAAMPAVACSGVQHGAMLCESTLQLPSWHCHDGSKQALMSRQGAATHSLRGPHCPSLAESYAHACMRHRCDSHAAAVAPSGPAGQAPKPQHGPGWQADRIRSDPIRWRAPHAPAAAVGSSCTMNAIRAGHHHHHLVAVG